MKFKYPSLDALPREQPHLPNPKILDKYPYLEDPSDERTKAFVKAQNTLFQEYIHGESQDNVSDKDDSTSNSRSLHAAMKSEIESMLDSERIGNITRKGKYMYFSRNTGLQNQDVMYQMPWGGSDAKYNLKDARVFIDPNKLSDDGTVSLGSMAYSRDGKYLAYGLQEKGSDWQTLHVMNCETLEVYKDEIPHCKFTSISWLNASDEGFFYTRYPPGTLESKNEYQKVYFHKLGNSWEQDECIYNTQLESEKEYMFDVIVSHDDRYLIIGVTDGCDPVNKLWVAPLNEPTRITKVIDEFKAGYFYITNDAGKFYFRTNADAPRYKVITMQIEEGLDSVQDLIPQDDHDVLEFAVCSNQDYLLVGFLHNVHCVLQLRELVSGKLIRDVPTPELSSIATISARREYEEVFYKVSSFTLPPSIFQYNYKTHESELVYQTSINFSVDDVVTKQVWYTSKDGTKIPMFIVHKKDIQLNGENPTLLYGYGGFNISLEPGFSALRLFWCNKFNGVYCIANLRGGGEFGEEWHKAGSLKNKQNCFDDFISAAEYLIDNKYTKPSKLIIEGGSNGGLLVGACVNQRPDLFALGLAHVGVMDMLNFSRFTIGHAWITDYGDPTKEDFFPILLGISPLHNIQKDTVYPAVLGLTAEQDDRVVPSHTLKWMAELQDVAGKNPNQVQPLMLRVDTSAGHGGGNALTKKIESEVDKYLFALRVVDGLKYE